MTWTDLLRGGGGGGGSMEVSISLAVVYVHTRQPQVFETFRDCPLCWIRQ